ncbi:electron transfer flavoprotein alpha-subunit [Nemania sp. NC0429]|nr:electron transfer flavoprotein alpha-subunit [Nemania sp. NC0429]
MASSQVTLRSDAAASLLEPEKTLRASAALVAHLKSEAETKAASASKKDLLAENDDDNAASLGETPVLVTFTTKRHPIESRNLKPTKIPTPFPIETDPDMRICLIVADPQRHYKNLVADPEFPDDLRKNVSRIIDFGKLKKKFTAYENQRALYAEHDIFRGKRVKPAKGEVNSCTAIQLSGEIKRAVAAALVNLSPSTNHAVKIGYASWKPEELAANAEKVVSVMVNKLISGGRKNIRSIYLKGPETVALPIYLTDELWVDKEKDVLTEDAEKAKALLAAEKANVGKKRKSVESTTVKSEPATKKSKKAKPAKLPESNDDKLDKEIADRKAALKKQKKAAKKALDV